jgi:hypothetical protein
MIDSLLTYQNPDGGWPYHPGGSSWTEPTVLTLLAGYANRDNAGRDRALAWVRRLERPDGGWSPKPGVDQSTWVTALAALLPPVDLGETAHGRAIKWLVGLTPANATFYARMRAWLSRLPTAEPNAGWPWLPGTAAWATPTAISILALARQNRRKPDSVLKNRIQSARDFLLTHRCPDGGWNHGSAKALGVDAPSYPETTGTALLAVARMDAAAIAPSIKCAEAWWKDCPSSAAASWLRLGLGAAGHVKDTQPDSLKPRTISDAALRSIAAAGDRGLEVFIA